MSDKPNVVISSLKEVQDMAASDPHREARTARPKSAPPKTQALHLVAGILEDTASQAAAERQRLEEDLRKKAEEEREREQSESRRRREAAERKLAEEDERRRVAAERRTAALEQMRIEELKAQGLWKEPEVAPAPVVAAPVRPVQTTAEVAAIARKSSRTPLFAAAAAVVLIGGGLAAFLVLGQKEHVDTTTTYPRASPTLLALAPASATVAFRPIPKPPEPEVEAAPAAAGPTRSGAVRKKPAGGGAAAKPPERKTINLGNNFKR